MANNNSQHRPAARVDLSLEAWCKERIRQAEVLEKQLADLPTTSKQNAERTNQHLQEQGSRMRAKLCEILSDLLCSDPAFALAHDCVGRLWRHCFYGPIGVYRSRLSKEKRKQGKNVVKYEAALKKFVLEAVDLFDYFESQFHDKLAAANGISMTMQSMSTTSSTQGSQSQSQGSQSLQPQPSTDTKGVTRILFRVYIHMGDLHRYAANYLKAQSCYEKASKLAPGMGNPYNQLAVVAQLKDTDSPLNCVALYWYARSLLTTHEPFEISKANLKRLFQSNREWFKKQTRPDEVLQQSANNNGANNGGRELQRTQRTALSRHFLSEFVDLHFSFFQGVSDDAMSDLLMSDEAVVQQIQSALGPFSILLKASAFGDALLCKMVTICIFSEVYNPVTAMEEADPNDERVKRQREVAARLTPVMARTLTLAFGACLAERAAVGITKIKDQPERMGNPGKSPRSVRLLLPLLLLFEFVESRPVNFDQVQHGKTREYCENTLDRFWQQIAEMMNILNKLRSPLQLNKELASGKLNELQNLLGFSPCDSFLNDERESSREGGFASVAEAVDVLELSGLSQSQEAIGSNQEASSVEEYKTKVARFLAVGDRAAARGERFIRSPNGSYVWREKDDEDRNTDEFDNDMLMMDTEDDKEETQPPTAAEADDEGGDMLVYNVPEGGGPALLVPGMILQNRAIPSGSNKNEQMSTMASTRAPVYAAPVDENKNNLAVAPAAVVQGSHLAPQPPHHIPTGSPPGIMPPPGFDGGGGHIAPGPPVGIVSAVPPQNMAAFVQPAATVPPQGVSMMQGGATLPQGYVEGMVASSFRAQQTAVSQERGIPTVGDSLHLFGGAQAMQTDNPFAAASMPSHDVTGLTPDQMGLAELISGNGGEYHGSAFLGSDNSGTAESSLLGSGLLTSMFLEGTEMTDKITDNPFR